MRPTKYIFFFLAFFVVPTFIPYYSYSQSPYHPPKPDKFGGIGISVDIDSSAMLPYIVDILSAKPGAMAGLRSGDHIISINGWKTKGKSQEKVAGKLRGRVGSKVDLVIKRDGKDTDFAMKREHIIVNEKAGNFCEALDTIMKSKIDNFSLIKSKMHCFKEQMLAGGVRHIQWVSNLDLPGFAYAGIDSDDNFGPYFKAIYFIGKDSIESLNKYNKLTGDFKDCIPYSVCKSYDTDIRSLHNTLYAKYKITSVKAIKYKSLVGSTITIWFGHDTSSLYEVWLDWF